MPSASLWKKSTIVDSWQVLPPSSPQMNHLLEVQRSGTSPSWEPSLKMGSIPRSPCRGATTTSLPSSSTLTSVPTLGSLDLLVSHPSSPHTFHTRRLSSLLHGKWTLPRPVGPVFGHTSIFSLDCSHWLLQPSPPRWPQSLPKGCCPPNRLLHHLPEQRPTVWRLCIGVPVGWPPSRSAAAQM